MRIAQIAPLTERVPPVGYGGTELVISLLTEELSRRGHEVTLFATSDSQTEARLVSAATRGLRQSGIAQRRWAAYEMKSLIRLEKMQDDFDIVHNHAGYLALPFLRNLSRKSVTTLHNPVKEYCSEIFLAYKDLPFVAISNAYRLRNYPNELNYVATIHNGIDIQSFDYRRSNQGAYLLFVGRMCADKGPVEAIEIANRLELPIVLAGKIDKDDREYFNELVRPLLSKPEVQYVGEVSTQVKNGLYSSAIATICPVKYEEPFGLVLAESIACGTPVMALARGAVPEVIVDGESGIVCDTIDDLVKRFPEIRSIDRSICRSRAELLFSKERMADQYEALYKRLCVSHLDTSQRR